MTTDIKFVIPRWYDIQIKQKFVHNSAYQKENEKILKLKHFTGVQIITHNFLHSMCKSLGPSCTI
jgi:hypothetical protein